MNPIKVTIADEEKYGIDPSWINQQINRRRSEGKEVCVRVTIRTDDLDMILSTPGCPKGSGGRQPRPRERQIFELWDERGLNQPGFEGGAVIAFLRQAERFI